MKVYQVRCDVNNYQTFLLEDDAVWDTDMLTFDCRRMAADWVAPKVFVLEPNFRRGNFPYLTPGALIADQKAFQELEMFFEMAGEVLSLEFEGEPYSLLNVTECINVLDQEKTVWKYGMTSGARIGIRDYHFHPDRFTESSLFKIPETCRGEILTYTGLKDPEDEFMTAYQNSGLEGLVFEEIWSDE